MVEQRKEKGLRERGTKPNPILPSGSGWENSNLSLPDRFSTVSTSAKPRNRYFWSDTSSQWQKDGNKLTPNGMQRVKRRIPESWSFFGRSMLENSGDVVATCEKK